MLPTGSSVTEQVVTRQQGQHLIMESAGARIAVTSEPGVGSAFPVIFPA